MRNGVSEEVEGTMRKLVGLGEKMRGGEMELELWVIEKSVPEWPCRLLLVCKRERV